MKELRLPTFPSPARLHEVTRELTRTIRRLGLAGVEDDAPAGINEAAEIAWLRALLGSPRRIGPKDERRLRAAMPIAAGPAWQVLPTLRDAIVRGQLQVTGRTLTQALHWLPEDNELLAAWTARPPAASRERWGVVKPGRPLADQLADHVCQRRWTIDRALLELGLNSASPLARHVLVRLTAPTAARWLTQHPTDALFHFLSAQSKQPWVGRVGAALFGQLPARGLQPGDLQDGKLLSDFVRRFAEHLPPESDTNAVWRALGPGAEVIRWWQIQRDLDKFFSTWDAERQRNDYWRTKVKDIRAIHEYVGPCSLAILIGNHWYVEFGATGNAVYVYSTRNYEKLRPRFLRASHPAGLKEKSFCVRRMSHTSGWEYNFDATIANLSSRPDDAP